MSTEQNAETVTQDQDNMETTQTTTENPQLTVADLQLLSRIVDLASRRGAFQASELTQVGSAYNKLAAFLQFVDNSKKEGEEEGTESATTETAPTE